MRPLPQGIEHLNQSQAEMNLLRLSTGKCECRVLIVNWNNWQDTGTALDPDQPWCQTIEPYQMKSSTAPKAVTQPGGLDSRDFEAGKFSRLSASRMVFG